jgi:hypothetical protein
MTDGEPYAMELAVFTNEAGERAVVLKPQGCCLACDGVPPMVQQQLEDLYLVEHDGGLRFMASGDAIQSPLLNQLDEAAVRELPAGRRT